MLADGTALRCAGIGHSSISMRWFRSNRQLGARLSLIAMALQLVLTFAHVHPPQAAQANQQLSQAAIGSETSDQSGRTPAGLADLDCPICALIQLSSAATPSVAPALPLPARAEFAAPQPRADKVAAAAPRTSHRARAPPAA